MSFLSCAMSLQAAASRLAYSYGRDDMIMGSSLLKQFSSSLHVPPYALLVAAGRPGDHRDRVEVLHQRAVQDHRFATLGIYIAFQMVVLAALRARLKGWVPSGKYTLGAWGLPVNIAALVYGVLAMVNMAWPRTPGRGVVRQLDRPALRGRGHRRRPGLHGGAPGRRPLARRRTTTPSRRPRSSRTPDPKPRAHPHPARGFVVLGLVAGAAMLHQGRQGTSHLPRRTRLGRCTFRPPTLMKRHAHLSGRPRARSAPGRRPGCASRRCPRR